MVDRKFIKGYSRANDLARALRDGIDSNKKRVKSGPGGRVLENDELQDYVGSLMDLPQNRQIAFKSSNGEVWSKGMVDKLRKDRLDILEDLLLKHNKAEYSKLLKK